MNFSIFFQGVEADFETFDSRHIHEVLEHADAGGTNQKNDILGR